MPHNWKSCLVKIIIVLLEKNNQNQCFLPHFVAGEGREWREPEIVFWVVPDISSSPDINPAFLLSYRSYQNLETSWDSGPDFHTNFSFQCFFCSKFCDSHPNFWHFLITVVCIFQFNPLNYKLCEFILLLSVSFHDPEYSRRELGETDISGSMLGPLYVSHSVFTIHAPLG